MISLNLTRFTIQDKQPMSDTLLKLTEEWVAILKNLYLDLDSTCVDFTDKNGCSFSLEASKLQDGKVYGTVCEWEYNAYDHADEDETISVELCQVTQSLGIGTTDRQDAGTV